MHTFNRNSSRDFGVIVHDQRRERPGCQFVQLRREIDKLIDGLSLSAKLDQINTAFDHCFSDARNIGGIDVTEINDAVELAGI